ncbi:MAG: methyltransferase domain-containing protein [Rhizobiales bacterium]|nr:methyltransferase domain-containing protein [Hyphomicrobiales bacterium]
MTSEIEEAVTRHYARRNLFEDITRGLTASGANLEALTPSDLAPVDEFHTAGRIATLQALAEMPLADGMHLLDAGCGIGGTARCLAIEYGCRVTGVDLTPEFIETARLLSSRMAGGERCSFQVASVLNLPFAAGAFDGAVTMHVAMNVPDRARFYSELARVVRPGGPLCVFDVMKGPGPGMRYPVPWAETEATSFLFSRNETVALLAAAGFRLASENNMRDFAIGFFREVFAKAAAADGPPPLGLHLLTGANAREKFTNYAAALDAHQIEPVILVAERT